MHIVHLYKDYHPVHGGIERVVQGIAEHQARRGNRVTVLVTNPGGQLPEQELNGVQVIRAARLATIASTPISIALPIILRNLKPDLAHLHFPYPLGEVSQWLLGRDWPYVISYHCDVVRQAGLLRIYGPVLNRVLGGAARILPTSSNYLHSSPWLRSHASNCTVIPLGIDPATYMKKAEFKPLDRWPELKGIQRPWVLFLGRHRYYKGVDDLIKALQYTGGSLLIGGDGKQRGTWEKLVRELELDNRVCFLGNIAQPDLPGLYQSADCFVLPANSRAEAFGVVLLEAMAAGLPCITTELSTGTSYLVQDGKNGFVVAPCRPVELADAIRNLLGNPGLFRGMGKIGRDRVLKEFTLTGMVQQIHDVYQSILATRGGL